MLTVRAALAVAVVLLGAQAPLHAAELLTLDDAFRRVIDDHPDLAVLRYQEAAWAADVDRAAQTPALVLEVTAENALGTGAAAGTNGVELTLSLASVIERSDKRGARIGLAEQRMHGLELLRAGKRLDLLAEVARRYFDVAAARAQVQITREDLVQRERLLEAANQRARAGGTPASVPLAAEVARHRVRLDLDRTLRREVHLKRRLAILWGDGDVDFSLSSTDLQSLPGVPDYPEFLRRLANIPELKRFAHEARLREARLQLARTAREVDVDWQVGVRRLQAEGDWGLVGSLSIPFGTARRAEPEVRAAQAELAAIEMEREGAHRALQATLAEAWGQLDLAVATAQQIDSVLVPALTRAAQAAEKAYRAGALGYLEWGQLQADVTATQRERLDASLAAHRALIELQRLTGETIQVAGSQATAASP